MSEKHLKKSWFPLEKVWHLPVILMLGIYLPASLFGAIVFRDVYSSVFLALLAMFVAIYYGLYRPCAAIVRNQSFQGLCWSVGDRFDWRALAWIAVGTYLATLVIAVSTVPETPLAAALRGGDWLDVSVARGNLFANRQGGEAILRYSALILGKSILPLLLTYLFVRGHKARYWALAGLLCCYIIALEKASPIFAFLPLILIALTRGKMKQALGHVLACLLCIAIWTFLSTGGLHREGQPSATVSPPKVAQFVVAEQSPVGFSIGRRGDPQRHYFFNFLNALGIPFDNSNSGATAGVKLKTMINRSIWIPYVTAYDWLKFHDEILGGSLTMGQSIGGVSWLTKKPRMLLEQMVYEYEFGVPPGGAGASNTVFLVDAKLAFGWVGVLIYCVIFVFCSAAVFTSRHEAVKLASVTSFFTATVSPLTATLLSGGLFFCLLLGLLVRPHESGRSV